jgi:hypothetical protein
MLRIVMVAFLCFCVLHTAACSRCDVAICVGTDRHLEFGARAKI